MVEWFFLPSSTSALCDIPVDPRTLGRDPARTWYTPGVRSPSQEKKNTGLLGSVTRVIGRFPRPELATNRRKQPTDETKTSS